MDSPFTTLPEIERTISDIEERINVKIKKIPVPVPVHVAWKCIDPADVWSLLGSISHDRITYLSDELKFKKARSVPVTIRYADSCSLLLRFGKSPKKQRFRALEDFDIDYELIRKKAESGSLVLGTDQQPPWKLQDIRLALRKLQEMLLNAPDDLCRSIESIHFEAPYERLRGLEISVNSGELSEHPEIVWLIVPPRKLTGEEAAAVVSLLHNKAGITIIPLLGLPWNVLHDKGEEYSDPILIERHLQAIYSGFGETYAGELFPTLPLYRNAFIADKTERGNFEPKCLDLIWQATHALGYTRFIQRTDIARRFDDLVSAMMKPPKSIIELLQYRLHLKRLQTSRPVTSVVPDKKVFLELQKEGMQEYSEQAKNLGKRTMEKWEPAATFTLLDSASKILMDYCIKTMDAECFENEKNEFIRLAENVSEIEFSILIIGRFKSGKTTFINTLLGQDILNTDLTPGTAIPWRLHRATKKPHAVLHFKDRATFPLIQVGSDSRLQDEDVLRPEKIDDAEGVFFLRVDETDAIVSWLKDGLIDRGSSFLICYSGDTEDRIPFDSPRAEKILKGLGRVISTYKVNSAGKADELLSITPEFLQTLDLQTVRLNADIVFLNPQKAETTKFDAKNIIGNLRTFMSTCETSRVAFRIGYSDLYLSFSDQTVLANCMIVDTPGSGSVNSYHDEIIRETACKADCYVVLLEIDQPRSSSDIDFIAEVSRMVHDYGRPLFVIAAKADRISGDRIDEHIREWKRILSEKNVYFYREQIVPVAAYQSRYSDIASLPKGHDKASIDGLRSNFQSVVKQIRDHIEIYRGMSHIVKFGERIDNLIKSAGKRLVDKEKDLRKRYKEFEKSSVTPEKIEKAERAEIFWGDFVSASLRKVEIQPPDDTVKTICKKAKYGFYKYLSLISANEESFEKCKREQWPKIAKRCMKDTNKLIEDITHRWENELSEELGSLDDFREENFSDEPALNRTVNLESGNIPVLQISLAVPITRKPGILKSILTFSNEENEWKKQTIDRFKSRVEHALDNYQTEVIFWLKNVTGKIDKLIKNLEAEAKRNTESTKQRIAEYKTILKTGNKPERQKIMDKLTEEKKLLGKRLNSFKKYEKEWKKEKSSLIIKNINK